MVQRIVRKSCSAGLETSGFLSLDTLTDQGIFPWRSITSIHPQYDVQNNLDKQQKKIHGQIAEWRDKWQSLHPAKEVTSLQEQDHRILFFFWLREYKWSFWGQADFTGLINFTTHTQEIMKNQDYLAKVHVTIWCIDLPCFILSCVVVNILRNALIYLVEEGL